MLEKSLNEALKFAGIGELPKKWDNKTPFVRAIALFAKVDGSKGYGIVWHHNDGTSYVKAVFGSSSSMAKIEEVYPYENLNKNYIPKFRKDDEEKKRQFVESSKCGIENVQNLTGKDLDNAVVTAAMCNQMNNKDFKYSRVEEGEEGDE